jgi:hypothetical protein
MALRKKSEPDVWSQMVLAMSYAQSGRKAEAAAAVADLLRRFPDDSFERIMSDFGLIPDQSTFGFYLDGARKAGLPDCATPEQLQKYPKMTHLPLCDAKRAASRQPPAARIAYTYGCKAFLAGTQRVR